MKFRKKPVVIEAVQFKVIKEIPCKYGIHKEYNDFEIINFVSAHDRFVHVGTEPNGSPEGLTFIEIPTLEGTMRADVGDWIIKGVANEFYPCKPEIFNATYEPCYRVNEIIHTKGEVSMPNYLSESNDKSVFLYVRGDDYSALCFDKRFNAQDVYEDMISKGETSRTIDDEDYMDIDIVEFDKVNDKFLSWIKNNLCDYDQLKSEDIFEVRAVTL